MPRRRYPAEVRRQVVDLARAGTKVARLAKTFGVSDATIYNWLKQERIDRGEVEGLSTEQISELAAAKRKIQRHGRGVVVGHNAVSSIMREIGIKGLPTRRLPKGARVGNVASLDLVRRRFSSEAPDRLWMTDIERHEALRDRAEVRFLRGPPVAAGGSKLGAA